MFRNFSQIIKKAQLSRLHLVIIPDENGNLTVSVNAEKGQGKVENSQLRAALSEPLILKGTVGELDESFFNHFDQYGDTFTQASLQANTVEVTKSISDALPSNEDSNDNEQEENTSPKELTSPIIQDENSAL